MAQNKKDERVRKLWERGVYDRHVLARKLGYTGGAHEKGLERVQEAIERMGLVEPPRPPREELKTNMSLSELMQ